MGRDPEVVRTFRALLAAARRNGPVRVLAEKTRIAFQVRMSFAAFTLRRHWLDGHVVLTRRRDSPRFKKIWTVSPRNQVHEFRLRSPSEVDAEVADWLREAYEVGEQRHLTSGLREADASVPRNRPTLRKAGVSRRQFEA